MSDFKVGDRVRLTGEIGGLSPEMAGIGVVCSVGDPRVCGDAIVRFNERVDQKGHDGALCPCGSRGHWFCLPTKLALATPAPEPHGPETCCEECCPTVATGSRWASTGSGRCVTGPAEHVAYVAVYGKGADLVKAGVDPAAWASTPHSARVRLLAEAKGRKDAHPVAREMECMETIRGIGSAAFREGAEREDSRLAQGIAGAPALRLNQIADRNVAHTSLLIDYIDPAEDPLSRAIRQSARVRARDTSCPSCGTLAATVMSGWERRRMCGSCGVGR